MKNTNISRIIIAIRPMTTESIHISPALGASNPPLAQALQKETKNRNNIALQCHRSGTGNAKNSYSFRN